jgi:hypothetical protein
MAYKNFRDAIREVSPPWLQYGTAWKLLYVFGLHLDALVEMATAGVQSKFPGLYSNESLELVGRDRRITRGRLESDKNYAERMIPWLDDHRARGNPYPLLRQLRGHFAPLQFQMDVVYQSGTRRSMAPNGEITRDTIAWSPDTRTDLWSRFWLVLFWPTPIADDGIWADPAVWNDGGTWDSELSVEEVDDFRGVPRDWSAEHIPYVTIVLLTGGADLWDYPGGTWDDPGTWTEQRPIQLIASTNAG